MYKQPLHPCITRGLGISDGWICGVSDNLVMLECSQGLDVRCYSITMALVSLAGILAIGVHAEEDGSRIIV